MTKASANYKRYSISFYPLFLCFILGNPLHASETKEVKEILNYGIKKDYISRTTYTHHDDRGWEDQAQDEVYFTAYQLVKDKKQAKIGDIGCGSGFKLIKYFSQYDTIGFEIEPTLSWLREKYSNRQWESSELYALKDKFFDLLICADVIEHLVDPDLLLNSINSCNFEFLVLSTPDRDLLPLVQGPGQCETGPPVNQAHVREWGFEEFASYISCYFDIVAHVHSKKEFWGQTLIAKKKHQSSP